MGGIATVAAESVDESIELVEFALREGVRKEQNLVVESMAKVRKHKVHLHKKTCQVCGKVCRGNQGLGGHMSFHVRRGQIPNALGEFKVPVKSA